MAQDQLGSGSGSVTSESAAVLNMTRRINIITRQTCRTSHIYLDIAPS